MSITWSNGRITSKKVQPPAAQTEVFNDVEDLYRLLHISHLRLLSDDQVNVHIGMDEVSISAPTYCPFNSHQTVFLEEMRLKMCAIKFDSNTSNLTKVKLTT